MYGRKVKGKTLTFCVSGQLWNRSLVMMDLETESLWSHILGECVDGKMKGAVLDVLPGDTMTWKHWRQQHPATTVLNLRRSSRNYTNEFYTAPEKFAVGLTVDHEPYHCTFSTLKSKALLNVTIESKPLLITFDAESTSARVFSRRLDDQELEFEITDGDVIRDQQTKSEWNRMTGVAENGPLKGKSLAHHAAILTFTDKWKSFHDESTEIKGE